MTTNMWFMSEYSNIFSMLEDLNSIVPLKHCRRCSLNCVIVNIALEYQVVRHISHSLLFHGYLLYTIPYYRTGYPPWLWTSWPPTSVLGSFSVYCVESQCGSVCWSPGSPQLHGPGTQMYKLICTKSLAKNMSAYYLSKVVRQIKQKHSKEIPMLVCL